MWYLFGTSKLTHVVNFIKYTRGPWTAAPARIKVIELETGCQQIFLHAKNCQNWLWENASVQSHIFNPKAYFSVKLFGVRTLEYKAASSVVFTTG